MQTEHAIWKIKGRQIPVKIHYEYRKGSRVSIGKNAVLVRIPSFLPAVEKQKQINWAKDWLSSILAEKPEAINHIIIEDLPQEYRLKVLDDDILVVLNFIPDNYVNASMKNSVISVSIGDSLSLYDKKQYLQKIISKVLMKRYRSRFIIKVEEINRRTFKVPFDQVKLKNMSTRWGSCSSKGNLNFSTRLLLCPQFVREYVIIHELAHRLEMNHSARFWGHVESAMPDYQEAEKWLKVHGKKMNFV